MLFKYWNSGMEGQLACPPARALKCNHNEAIRWIKLCFWPVSAGERNLAINEFSFHHWMDLSSDTLSLTLFNGISIYKIVCWRRDVSFVFLLFCHLCDQAKQTSDVNNACHFFGTQCSVGTLGSWCFCGW